MKTFKQALDGALRMIAEAMRPRPKLWEPDDRFEIRGHGTVFTGAYPFDCDISAAIGRELRIAGKVYRVRGVEWNLVRRPTRGDAVGILVGERP